MNIRHPLRAGSFYEGEPSACRHHAQRLLDSADPPDNLPAVLYGGLVPHAGWVYSGRLAAMTLRALAQAGPLDTVVLLGADHCGAVQVGEVYDSGAWRTPLGDVAIDEPLAAALIDAADCLRANGDAHAREHSIEVQVPLLQVLQPQCKIVPVAVPPTELAVRIGMVVGQTLAQHAPNARVIGSTDLSHHAGHFPAPGGRGREGVAWAVENDRRLIDLVEAMAAETIVPETHARMNACGAGAVAAAIAASVRLGATRGICLQYTNSYEITHAVHPDDPDDTTVGYASVVFA